MEVKEGVSLRQDDPQKMEQLVARHQLPEESIHLGGNRQQARWSLWAPSRRDEVMNKLNRPPPAPPSPSRLLKSA